MGTFKPYLSKSGWAALARHQYIPNTLEQDLEVDFTVVGAGFAGLALARQLALLFPERQIALLDADDPMQNSSARNSGFMIEVPYTKINNQIKENEEQWQQALMQQGKDQLLGIVELAGLDCGWSQIGHYKAAATESGAAELEKIGRTLTAKGLEFRSLSQSDIQNELGTHHYRAAIWLPFCALVQPAELVQAALLTLPSNVHAYFNSRVDSTEDHTTTQQLNVGKHTVRTKHLAWCINTHLAGFGMGTRRQLAMYTYAAITRAFDETELYLGRDEQWGTTPVERLEATTRKLPGNRLLLRAGFSYKHELSLSQQRAVLLEGLRARHPEINENDIEHQWGGAISMTRNGAPLLTKLGNNTVVLSGCNASGILKMTALGTRAADLLVGNESATLRETVQYCRPSYIPPEPLRKLGVEMSIRKFKRELQQRKM